MRKNGCRIMQILSLGLLITATGVSAALGNTNKEFSMPDTIQSFQGITPYQVFQRDSNGKGLVLFTGKLSKNLTGTLETRVTKGSSVIQDWKAAGVEKGTEFSGKISGIPTGGEYQVEIRLSDGTVYAIPHLMVGDLWVLAGQSNMDGYGKLVDLEEPSEKVHCFYMDDHWGVAKDPVAWLNSAVDPVHWASPEAHQPGALAIEKGLKERGGSLGIRFGKELVKATGVPVALIPCSHSGTGMDEWSPALKDKGGNSLYGAMLRRINVLGGRIAGVLWYQGEADTGSNLADTYTAKMKKLISSIREDVNDPNMPFIYAQLSIYHGDIEYTKNWNVIQTLEGDLEKEVPNVAMAPTVDLSLADIIHLDSISQRTLGARMAHQARILRFGDKKFKFGPRFDSAQMGADRKSLTIHFKEVNGSLKKVSPLYGFMILSNGMVPIESSEIGKDSIVLHFENSVGPNATLWYGKGLNPTVNLYDAAGMPCPVFGPVQIP